MNKVRILSLVSIVLLLINIVIIGVMVSHRSGRAHAVGPRRMIIEKLHFDETQQVAYQKLIDAHIIDVKKGEQQIQEYKRRLYATLNSAVDLSARDSLIAEMAKLQMSVEQIHYRHFQDIKALCKPDQQKAFEAFTLEISDLFQKGQRGPR
jgi:periplasmic protein CpxP/Spy